MKLDKYTLNAQNAILEAQRLAGEYNHTSIEPAHVLLALVSRQEGVVSTIITRWQHSDAAT